MYSYSVSPSLHCLIYWSRIHLLGGLACMHDLQYCCHAKPGNGVQRYHGTIIRYCSMFNVQLPFGRTFSYNYFWRVQILKWRFSFLFIIIMMYGMLWCCCTGNRYQGVPLNKTTKLASAYDSNRKHKTPLHHHILLDIIPHTLYFRNDFALNRSILWIEIEKWSI